MTKPEVTPASTRVVAVSDSDLTPRPALNQDELDLARAGHVAQLSRKLGFWSMLFTVYILMSSWQTYMSSVIVGLTSGGSVAMLWGYIAVWVCTLFSAASIAELLSIWPTAAGQIHWSAVLAPQGYGPAFSFACGWLTILGQVALSAAAAFVVGGNYVGMFILTHQDFVSSRYQTIIGYWGILAVGCLFNVFLTKRLALLNYLAIVMSMVGWIVTIVIQASMSPTHNSPKFVFTDSLNLTGWDNNGIVWILGLLQSAYALVGYDVVAHLSEEMADASLEAPRALMLSILSSGLFAIPYLIVVLFFIGDITTIAASPTGFPFLQIMYDCTQNAGASILLSFATTGMAMIAIPSLIASTSRTIWAFSRDGGLPFSRTFAKVNTRLDVPVNAVLLTTVLMAIPGIIYLGNATAFNAFLSVTVIALNLSYLIPIGLMLFGGRRRTSELGLRGRWSLGKFGPVCNVIGGSYCIFISFFLFFPTARPVTGSNMNYACVIIGLVTIAGLAHWFAPGGARTTYRGPVEEVVVTDAEEDYATEQTGRGRIRAGEQSQEINEAKE